MTTLGASRVVHSIVPPRLLLGETSVNTFQPESVPRRNLGVRAAARGPKRKSAPVSEERLHSRNDAAKQEALDRAMADINAQWGDQAVRVYGDSAKVSVERISTSCPSLDAILDGGLPKGRIVEIYGQPGCGKTTIALHAIGQVQKAGGRAVYVDAEYTFDPQYAERLGVNVSNLLLLAPDHGDMALEAVDRLVRSGAVDICVVDSVAALLPKTELEGEVGQPQMGAQARMMSQGLRKLVGNNAKANCTLVFINQTRQKSVVGAADVGIRTRVKVVKSKVSKPYLQTEFDIMFGHGISRLASLVDTAESMNILDKKGAWYSYGEMRLGQGREKVIALLEEQKDLCNEIDEAVRKKIEDDATANHDKFKGVTFVGEGEAVEGFEDEGDMPEEEEREGMYGGEEVEDAALS